MKKTLLFLAATTFAHFSNAQSVGIGTTTPNTNAALEIKSNNKGVLMPRLSSSSRNGMTNVQKGMMVYDSTLSAFYYHDGSRWREFSEKNTDSLIYSGYINAPQTTANMPPLASEFITTESSGILYDNGGPMANYANASTDAYVVYQANNDSIIGYKVIVEQMNLAPGDTLGIYVAGDESSIVFFSGNKTGTFYFAATSGLIFGFNSNARGNAAGFKIRWGVVNAISATNTTPPLYGWYFNDKKIAVRGGINSADNLAPDSIGRLSFAYGGNAKAKGVNAMAVGSVVSASGDYSRAMGLQSTASGNNSTAIGQMAVAKGDMSFAHGFKAFASGYGSVAFGNNNEVNGDRSFAFGSANKVLVRSGIAIGTANTVLAENSVAIGIGNEVLNVNSIALGISATASSPSSTALCYRAEASGNNAIAL